eukprot:3963102-Pyramimonas_sp.AAC.1
MFNSIGYFSVTRWPATVVLPGMLSIERECEFRGGARVAPRHALAVVTLIICNSISHVSHQDTLSLWLHLLSYHATYSRRCRTETRPTFTPILQLNLAGVASRHTLAVHRSTARDGLEEPSHRLPLRARSGARHITQTTPSST